MSMRAEHSDEPQFAALLNCCHFGDCIETMRRFPDGIVQTCVTSPPYFGLRDYGHAGQIGLEPTPDAYVAKLVDVFREVRRVLREDATLWLNLGDSYGGAPGNTAMSSGKTDTARGVEMFGDVLGRNKGGRSKDLIGIPWRVAFALQADGWYLRQDIIWAKPNPMPESVTDRCTKSHEYIFLLSKSATYHYDHEAVKEEGVVPSGTRRTIGKAKEGSVTRAESAGRKPSGNEAAGFSIVDGSRNKRSVWTVASEPYSGAHFATFPTALIEPCILAGAPVGGVVLDPFLGSGTTAQVAQDLGRHWIGCELNPAYAQMQRERVAQTSFLLEAA